MMSSPSSRCASASDFTESHAERACKEAKSTCAGADLPELEGAGASVDGGVRVDIGWWFSFGGVVVETFGVKGGRFLL